jgi:transcription initiation factor TFIIIB Brf1 subunit/transcription initiation factor TFIIB
MIARTRPPENSRIADSGTLTAEVAAVAEATVRKQYKRLRMVLRV